MKIFKSISVLAVFSLVACGHLVDEKVAEQTPETRTTEATSSDQKGATSSDQIESTEVRAEQELIAPSEFGGPWARKLVLPAATYSQMTVEKFDKRVGDFIAVGYLNPSGVYIDYNISQDTRYRFGSKMLSQDFSAVEDLILQGEIKCVPEVNAYRIVIPSKSTAFLKSCSQKWTAEIVILDGTLQSFLPEESNGLSAGVLTLSASHVSGLGDVRLNGQQGKAGQNGAAGKNGDEGGDGGNATNGSNGASGGDGGKIILMVKDLVFQKFQVSGGGGGLPGKGGVGGAAGPQLCYLYGADERKSRCVHGQAGKDGTSGYYGRPGREGFVINTLGG